MNKLTKQIRKITRHAILTTLGSFKAPAPGIHLLNGHMITREAGAGTLRDRAKFERLLNELNKECDFINFQEAVHMIRNREQTKRTKVAFSFDDGFLDCYTHIAPALEKFNVNAMFFINSNFIDAGTRHDIEYINKFTEEYTDSPGKLPMTWKHISELQERGFLFGAHTLDHMRLTDVSDKEMERQIVECKKNIEEHTGISCDYFAWPYGRITDANTKAVDMACRTFKYVFSQGNYKKYFSYKDRVINRRHFESWWPLSHLCFFLSTHKK